jgi:predicted nucleic acid-binding protein
MRQGPNSPEYQILFENLPRTYLSSVVSGELHAGCMDDIGLQWVKPFTRHAEKTGRIVTPTHASWNKAGVLLAGMMRREPQYRSKATGLFMDILIALSTVQIGATVYTANRDDFYLIKQYHPFYLQVISKGGEQ